LTFTNSSVLKIKLFGDKGASDEVTLTEDGFEKGQTKKLTFEAKDVGILQMIKVCIYY